MLHEWAWPCEEKYVFRVPGGALGRFLKILSESSANASGDLRVCSGIPGVINKWCEALSSVSCARGARRDKIQVSTYHVTLAMFS